MNHDQVGHWLAGWRLGMHQHLDARFGVVEFRLHRKALLVQVAAPVVARDGKQVRIPKVWNEGPQQKLF
jgi:hypothetical protein